MKFYGFSDIIDYSKYLPLNQALSILKKYNGAALQVGCTTAYIGSEFIDFSDMTGGNGIVFCEGDSLSAELGLLGKVMGKNIGEGRTDVDAAAEKLGKEALVYENKLVVFLDKGSNVNVFDNFYTFEMISLRLRRAPDEDFENALMELPYAVSNGSSNSVMYSDSDLELGLATTMYSLQSGKDAPVRPKIAAGEGKNADNHTVVRVYNEYSAKTAQFLAFPPSVKGGVKIACASVYHNAVKRTLIAAAAYNAGSDEAKHINVFDEYGVICMQLDPEMCAPYCILAGRFGFECENDILFVCSEKLGADGELCYELYDLTDGKVIRSGSALICADSADKEIRISPDSDGILILAGKEAYRLSIADNKAAKLDIAVTDGTNGLFASAFSEGYITTEDVSSEEKHRSFIGEHTAGKESTIDVGAFENVFFWDTVRRNFRLPGAENVEVKEREYIKYAPFRHQRTDQASNAIADIMPEDVPKLAEVPYSGWKTGIEYSHFADSPNVWEPCFTHRFNIFKGSTALAKYKENSGFHKLLAYTKENETADYLELDSVFYNATYAEGIIELDKLRIYPLRDTLRSLHAAFVKSPESLAGLEPIHEIEIAVGDSVGDYNPYMIEGFRSYLIERFGCVENINRRFGSTFASREDIDAPRDNGRGDWDRYAGEYFYQWQIFTRKVVNKRLTESFREALLSGFPSEIISGHSIPEGDAISGFLEQANTRMSPVDAMMTLGCHFGATRYGTWYFGEKNFLDLSYSAGFRNVTMGEYNSMTTDDGSLSRNQLDYIWNHGSKYICILNISDSGTVSDLKALDALSGANKPRPGYAEGTSCALPVSCGEKCYQIVELGGDNDNPGLLKSVDREGRWTGDIYLCPFHSHIDVSALDFSYDPDNSAYCSDTIEGLQTGDVVEIGIFDAKANVKITVYEDDIINERLSTEYSSVNSSSPCRYALSNQVPLGKIKFVITADNKNAAFNVTGSVQRESSPRKFYGILDAREHRGGVNFDIFDI